MSEPKQLLQKIEQAPQTLRDLVQTRMREAIIDGHFAPGERLVERPLCDQLGVSRTVVRETIRYLEAEGLVEIIANRGPVVATLNWNQARQIYDVRRQLEGSAAAKAAEKITPDFAKKLTRALERLEAALGDTARSRLLRETSAFYELIFQQAGHTVAWEIVQRLNGRISRLRAMTIPATDRQKPGISHMRAIHAAILSGDRESARMAVETHIADAAQTAERFLGDASSTKNNY
ncbi:GntR family transcriptional regulator [uncultured Roseobacter sp.]|uniref:GntR family transcriptional regulator n=1 Tax=uncultured Roseobacter sp. TaxID=114847 RepID=UPI0026291D29|nr:GntR family transcriptional regulator [uncultured Roseobacter sp.]